ncbi:hypothetical protein [Pseudoalteromonas sp. BSi20495]|uniref:hypothetical protein n=1 Tax=Pseudoalteromonas sp. BSi20495 TaxID=386429 RepID=UPI0002316103|nr:hypothetical protein [Pseudoalteromonas sp. BSi20495]GAA78977.1 hypothetical protein P20495_1472 [Pseudoalteromonas sp. BSi20495]
MNKENILIVVLGLLAAGTIGLEISTSGATTTKTESTLFGVLQFVFSIAFAWFLSKYNSKSEFESQQKKFAVAAFRRIKEIESQTTHLIERLNRAISDNGKSHIHELDIARTLALSINETTQSSKLDWADVIGEQIEALDKIQNIQKQKAILKSTFNFSELPTSIQSDPRISQLENEVVSLKETLSTELKLMVDDDLPTTRNELENEISEFNHIELTGFGGGNDDFETEIDVATLTIGETLDVSIEDTKERIATLIAKNSSGKVVGSFLNLYNGNYSDFTCGVCDVLEASKFSVTVSKLDGQDEETGRKYFKVIAKKA